MLGALEVVIGGTHTVKLGAFGHVGPRRGPLGALEVIIGGTHTMKLGAFGHVGPHWGPHHGPPSYYWRDPLGGDGAVDRP